MLTAPSDRSAFRIAIFCALKVEAENVRSAFDVCWEDDHGIRFGKAEGDQNEYSTGVIEGHHVVLVYMPGMGSNNAALAAAGLRSSFSAIRLALVVGVCGVVPIHPETKKQIFLGDVVISTNLIRYDYGRKFPSGFQRKKEVEDTLGHPNLEIRSFLNKLKVRQNQLRFNNTFRDLVSSAAFQERNSATFYPGLAHDKLYEATYHHQHRPEATCGKCRVDFETCTKHCDEIGCGNDGLVERDRHVTEMTRMQESECYIPTVHLGHFGSGNVVMRSGLDRDRVSATDNITAFEMEGAGLWEQYPTVVIKAACDYADSHKDKRWHGYAATMAAACLKVFLGEWRDPKVLPIRDQLQEYVVHVPLQYMPGFIGRDDELRKLEQLLFNPNGRRSVSLLGLGGMGKTRMAMELAYRAWSKHEPCSILWIQASDRSTFEKDILEIGRKLKIPGIDSTNADFKALVKQRLSSPSTARWLLILDNADDEALWARNSELSEHEQSLVNALPSTVNGSILVTTRTKSVASSLSQQQVVKLGAMMPDDATDLFKSKLEDPSLADDKTTLLTLVDRLASLPLALVQAASYVNMTEIGLDTYLDLLDQPEEEVVRLLSRDFGDTSRYDDAINPVASTWLISFEHIRQRHPLAAKFLSTLACVHPEAIPSTLLPETSSKIENIEAIAILTGYSFITKQQIHSKESDIKELYEIHRLVQLAARNWMRREESLVQCVKECMHRLQQIAPPPLHQYRGLWTFYASHALAVSDMVPQNALMERYELLECIGLWLLHDCRYDEAVQILREVASWRKAALSNTNDNTLRAYGYLGRALCKQGNLLEAESYLRLAVDGQIALSGEEGYNTVTAMSDLGSTLCSQGRYDESELLYRHVLRVDRRTLGDRHPDTVTSMINLADLFHTQSKYDEAEELYRDAMEIETETRSPDHPRTLIATDNFASVLRDRGQYQKAEEIHRDVVQRITRVLGHSHPDTLICMENLAEDLYKLDRLSEAEKVWRDVLNSRQAVLGHDHPNTVRTLRYLARSGRVGSLYEEAEKMYHRAVQLSVKALDHTHDITRISVNGLVMIICNQERRQDCKVTDCKVTQTFELEFRKCYPMSVVNRELIARIIEVHDRVEEAVRSTDSCTE